MTDKPKTKVDMHRMFDHLSRIVLCGVTSGPICRTNLQNLYWNQLAILGSTMGSSEDFRQMLKAVTAARLKPVIDSVYPIENVREAMAKMERGEQFGKITLSIYR